MNKNIFQRITKFFKNIFFPQKLLTEKNTDIEKNVVEENHSIETLVVEKEKNMFEKAEENRKAYELQKLYAQGKIKDEDMSEQQILALDKLFDKKIEEAKIRNANMKNKILKSMSNDKELIELFRKHKNGEIKEEELTEEQIRQIDFLYEVQIEKIKNEIRDFKKVV